MAEFRLKILDLTIRNLSQFVTSSSIKHAGGLDFSEKKRRNDWRGVEDGKQENPQAKNSFKEKNLINIKSWL
jgi:hypothetical protein